MRGIVTKALLALVLGFVGVAQAQQGVNIAKQIKGLGTGVATALGVNTGSAGSVVVNGGALGTPSSGTLTNATGLPVGTGVSGLGTGVATALGVNVGSAGAVVTNGGALGTPSSGTLTNATGLPISTGVSGLGANVATFLATPSSANLASALTDDTINLATGVGLPVAFCVAASDESTALTAGATKVTFRMPYAMTVTAVRGSLTVAQPSGAQIFTVDVNEAGTSILSTKLTIDNTELTSTTAATPPVISDSALADDASMTIDIDAIGDSGAKGLKVCLIGTRA